MCFYLGQCTLVLVRLAITVGNSFGVSGPFNLNAINTTKEIAMVVKNNLLQNEWTQHAAAV